MHPNYNVFQNNPLEQITVNRGQEGRQETYPSYSTQQSPVSVPMYQTVSHGMGVFKKSKWTSEEDRSLIESVRTHGMSNWSLVAADVPGRTGKQCRERWTNQLCPSLNRDNWTQQEDQILIKQQLVHGNLWSKISQFLPGRSANAVKNRWSWLSRHRVPDAFAAQMIPYMMSQQSSQDDVVRPAAPPMPMIHHIQQTAPLEMMTIPEHIRPGSDKVAFSEPTAFTSFETSLSASNSLYSMDDTASDLLYSLQDGDDAPPLFTATNDTFDSNSGAYWDNF